MARKLRGKATRRRFLTVAGATTASTALAGCLADDDDPDLDPDDDTADDDDTEDPDDTDDTDDADDTDPVEPLDEVTITQGEFITNPDPHDHIAGPYFNIFDQVYEPIFRVTPDIEFEPHIVTEWEHVGDGAELTVRDDVVFHDGTEMTAHDVAYSYNRQIDPEHSIESDQAAGLGSIDNAEALDDTTVFLEYEVTPVLAEFEYANYGRVVPEDFFEDRGHPITGDDETYFNGTGPLEVVDFEPEVEILMEPFDDYWGEAVDFDSVTFNADGESSGRVSSLETDESQLIDNVIPEDVSIVDENPDLEIRAETSLRNVFLVMKSGVEPFDSLEFRQAMNYAVDNEGIINTILGGFAEPSTQPIAEGVFGYNPDLDPYEQDLAQAEDLVDDSGYAGVEIELAAPEGRYLNDSDVAITAADQIDQLDNVDCSVDIVPFDNIVAASTSGFEEDDLPFHLIGWGTITGDADYGLAPFFVEEAPFESYRDEEISDAILETKFIDDIDEREQALQDINADLREAAPWVYLHNQDSVYGVNERLDWTPRVDESIYTWEMS